ncbi:MAG: phage tail tube protein [Alkalispirochaeta sp.]
MAQGSQRQLLYVAESTFGTTPGTPTMKVLRNTGGNGITQSRNQLLSQEMRSDRQIASMRLGTKRPILDIPFELSFASFDDILESAMFSTWDTGAIPEALETGVTQKSFTIEEGFLDIGTYLVSRGMVVDEFSISARPDAMVTGNVRFAGKAVESPSATALDSTPDAAPTTDPFTTYEGVINVDGSPVGLISSFDLSVANGLDPKFPVFAQEAYRMGYGRSNTTGTVNVFFEDADLLTKAIEETEISISIDFTDVAGNILRLTLPRVKFGDETRNVQENDITENLPWQALYDETAQTNIKWERIPV